MTTKERPVVVGDHIWTISREGWRVEGHIAELDGPSRVVVRVLLPFGGSDVFNRHRTRVHLVEK